MMRWFVLLTFLVVIVGCDPEPRRGPRESPQVTPDALDRMSEVFLGNPSRMQIQTKVDRALELYGLPKTEENYSRCGSALVAVRQDTGAPEMAVLDFAISLREEAPDVEISLPDAIGMGAAYLEAAEPSRTN